MGGAMIVVMAVMMGGMVVGIGVAVWTRTRKRLKREREPGP